MTTAMHGGPTPTSDGDTDESVIDLSHAGAGHEVQDELWVPSLYGPASSAAVDAPVPPPAAAPVLPPPAPPIDVDTLAAMAAEVAVSVARHREELAAAMAELTSLQRTLRSEVRAVIADLDRIAAGLASESATAGAVDAAEPSVQQGGRRPFWARLHRAH